MELTGLNRYLRHLVNFVHIVEAGSITAAANKQHVSPSVMSESLKILENHYREPLLERHHRGVNLTSRGHEVYPCAKVILEQASKALQISTPGKEGLVKISLPVELAAFWIHQPLKALAHSMPKVRVTLMCEDELLDHNKYTRDLFVRVSDRPADSSFSLNVLHQTTTRVVFVGHPDYVGDTDVNDLQAIQRLCFITAPDKSATKTLKIPVLGKHTQQKQKQKRELMKLEFARTLYASDIQVRLSLVRAGFGVMGCLEPTVREELEQGHLLELGQGQIHIPLVWMIASPHQQTPLLHSQVADVLAATWER